MIESGHIEKGFLTSDHILEGDIQIGGQDHFYIETQTSLVQPILDEEIVIHRFGSPRYFGLKFPILNPS